MNCAPLLPRCAAAYLTIALIVLLGTQAAPALGQCQVQDTNNCHNLDGENFTAISDLSMKPGGFVKADDVILESPQVNEICVWGVYFDGLNGPFDTHSCSELVEDDFRVRFYADDGGGKPDHAALIAQAGGNLDVAVFLGGVHVGPIAVVKSATTDLTATTDTPLNLEVFTLSFPTMTLPTGVTIWLEVANNTDTPTGGTQPMFNTCEWWWVQSQNIFGGSTGTGNEWSYAGTDHRPIGYPTDPSINQRYVERNGLTGYLELGHDWTDQVFCLSGPDGPVNFADPTAPTGACLDCMGLSTDNQTLAECTNRDPDLENLWVRGLVCGAGCIIPKIFGDECQEPITIFDGGFEAQTVCHSNSLPDCFPGNNCLSGDLWATYTTSCTGELVMSMCHSGISSGNYDSFISVHHDFWDPENCPCPADSLDFMAQNSNEGCNGEPDGGAGVVQNMVVFSGECWTVRLGGWTDDLNNPTHGITRLDVACLGRIHCLLSSPATLQRQFDENGDSTGDPEPKQRVLAIKAGDAGQEQAIRVTWDAQPNWPGGHDLLVGQQKWMTEPFQVCENSGDGLSKSPPNCGPSPGQPQKWFWAANLTCDSTAAHFADLTRLANFCTGSGESCIIDDHCAQGTCGVDGVIHLIDQGIVPSRNVNQLAIYSVQLITLHCTIDEMNFSEALVVTQPFFGDIGDGVDCPMAPPDGVVGLIPDVTSSLSKFSNGFCAPKKTRVDVQGDNIDFKVGIDDVLPLLDGFDGTSFPFPAGPACGAGG